MDLGYLGFMTERCALQPAEHIEVELIVGPEPPTGLFLATVEDLMVLAF